MCKPYHDKAHRHCIAWKYRWAYGLVHHKKNCFVIKVINMLDTRIFSRTTINAFKRWIQVTSYNSETHALVN